jgi:hypothetical protein
MANRARTNFRDGCSEITTELMSVTDAVCRSLLNLTAASEFYSVPQKLILGATEEDFLDTSGNRKSAWETYIGRILALQRDSEGALPEVKQFEAYDPSIFTKVIEMYAAQAAGIIGATPQELGLYTDGNPVSAEALQVSEARRDRRAKRMQSEFGAAQKEIAQLALRFMHNGDLPTGYDRLSVNWADTQMVNFTGYSDGIAKLAQEGMLARGSDVALQKLGFNASQRRQIAEEIAQDPSAQLINTLGTSVQGKAIRMANALVAAGQPSEAPGNTDAPGTGTASAQQQK